MNTSTIVFAGNLTDDPEIRYTTSGTAVAKITVAVNNRSRDAKGNWKDAPTTFHDVKVWGPQGENLTESLRKGQEVIVVGQVETETWKNKDGENRSRQVVVVNEWNGAIGAGLRYATAEITKATRTKTSSQPAEQPTEQNEPVSEPPF